MRCSGEGLSQERSHFDCRTRARLKEVREYGHKEKKGLRGRWAKSKKLTQAVTTNQMVYVRCVQVISAVPLRRIPAMTCEYATIRSAMAARGVMGAHAAGVPFGRSPTNALPCSRTPRKDPALALLVLCHVLAFKFELRVSVSIRLPWCSAMNVRELICSLTVACPRWSIPLPRPCKCKTGDRTAGCGCGCGRCPIIKLGI